MCFIKQTLRKWFFMSHSHNEHLIFTHFLYSLHHVQQHSLLSLSFTLLLCSILSLLLSIFNMHSHQNYSCECIYIFGYQLKENFHLKVNSLLFISQFMEILIILSVRFFPFVVRNGPCRMIYVCIVQWKPHDNLQWHVFFSRCIQLHFRNGIETLTQKTIG